MRKSYIRGIPTGACSGKKAELPTVNLVNDFYDLLSVMLDENLSEFQYIIDGEEWKIVKK